MSSRYITIEEINSILAALEDDQGIEILKQVRDNVVQPVDEKKQAKLLEGKSKEEQIKAQDKLTQEKALVGFSKEEDVAKDDDVVKKGILNRLAERGLLLKGGFIPKNGERINSFKITNEGLALLYLVDRVKGVAKERQAQQEEPKTQLKTDREERQAEREERRGSRSK